jgi:hypothetical protein
MARSECLLSGNLAQEALTVQRSALNDAVCAPDASSEITC